MKSSMINRMHPICSFNYDWALAVGNIDSIQSGFRFSQNTQRRDVTKNRRKLSLAPALVLVLVLLPYVFMGKAYGQDEQPSQETEVSTTDDLAPMPGEVASEGLALVMTSTKTNNKKLEPLSNTDPGDMAFTTTKVTCPKDKTCTVIVGLATQFYNISSGQDCGATVWINGKPVGVNPNSGVALGCQKTGGGTVTAAFQWMSKGLSGDITIDLYLSSEQNARIAPLLGAFYRTLKVELYTQPAAK